MFNFVQLTGTDALPSEKTAKEYAKLHGTTIPSSPDGARLYIGQFSAQQLTPPLESETAAASATTAARSGLPAGLVADRDYALKTLLGATSAENRVVLWSRTLNALPSHANVVGAEAIAFDSPHRASFLVMPYVTSLSLREYRHMAFEQHRAISSDSLRRIALDILCGLYHLRLHGLVHRNLHPGNVIVDITSGVTRVTDLSFSAVVHNGAGAIKASALAEKLAPESVRWADPALIAADAPAMATPLSEACDVWGFGNVLYGLFCSGDLNPMTPYVSGASPEISGASIDKWVGIEEKDDAALDAFRRDLASLMRSCLMAEPSARPSLESLFAHPFIFPAVVTALQQSRAAGAAYLFAHQQQEECSHLRSLFTGAWLEQFTPDVDDAKSSTELWRWVSGGVAQLKETVAEMMARKPAVSSAAIPITATAKPTISTGVTAGADGVMASQAPASQPPHALDINTPPSPLRITSPMGTRGFLTSARTVSTSVVTFQPSAAPASNTPASERWPASFGVMFEVEVPPGVSFVRLQDVCFATCGDVWDLRCQAYWSPGALLTGADAEDALLNAGWMPVCKKPRQLHKVMAKHPLSIGPFRATLHQHCEKRVYEGHHSNGEHATYGTRFTILLVTNYRFGVRRATMMATRQGPHEKPSAPLQVGDELAAATPADLKLRVFAGVTCDAAVPTAIGGVLTPENADVADDGDEGDSDLDEQPLNVCDRRVSREAVELENFQPLRSAALGAALVAARRRGEVAGFCGSIRYAAH